METAMVTTVEIGLGGFGLLFPCSRTILAAPRPVTVFGMVTASLPDGRVGNPYSASIFTGGGRPPYNWSLSGVRGLTISGSPTDPSTGVISGIPLDAGTNTAVVSVTDGDGLTAKKSFTITVTGASLKVAVIPQPGGGLALLFVGNGFQPGEYVNITTSPPLPLLPVPGPIIGLTDKSGSFTVAVAVAVDAPPGPYIMSAADLSSGLSLAETSFTIIATGCGSPGEPSCGAASPVQP
jgi:hypothetical protein